MISYKVGDIVNAVKDGDIQVVAHQTNCFNTLGGIVAKTLAKHHPEIIDADRDTVSGDKSKLGTFTSACINDGKAIAINLYGQYGFFRTASEDEYKSLRTALKKMAIYLSYCFDSKPKIGIVKFGTGIGIGGWGKIERIIESELSEYDVTIYVSRIEDIPQWI